MRYVALRSSAGQQIWSLISRCAARDGDRAVMPLGDAAWCDAVWSNSPRTRLGVRNSTGQLRALAWRLDDRAHVFVDDNDPEVAYAGFEALIEAITAEQRPDPDAGLETVVRDDDDERIALLQSLGFVDIGAWATALSARAAHVAQHRQPDRVVEAGALPREAWLGAHSAVFTTHFFGGAELRRVRLHPQHRRDFDVAVAVGDEVAGFAIGWPDAAAGAVHIEPLGTSPAYRRQGVAVALLGELGARAQAGGLSRLTVAVEANNDPALRLYERAGFVAAAQLRRFKRWV